MLRRIRKQSGESVESVLIRMLKISPAVATELRQATDHHRMTANTALYLHCVQSSYIGCKRDADRIYC